MASGETMPLAVLTALPLVVAPLRVRVGFLGAIGVIREAF